MKPAIVNALKAIALTIGYAVVSGVVMVAIFVPSFWTISLAIVVTFFSAAGMAKLYPETTNSNTK